MAKKHSRYGKLPTLAEVRKAAKRFGMKVVSCAWAKDPLPTGEPQCACPQVLAYAGRISNDKKAKEVITSFLTADYSEVITSFLTADYPKVILAQEVSGVDSLAVQSYANGFDGSPYVGRRPDAYRVGKNHYAALRKEGLTA